MDVTIYKGTLYNQFQIQWHPCSKYFTYISSFNPAVSYEVGTIVAQFRDKEIEAKRG